jgi:flavin-dependent dehydrogenase
MSDNVLPLYDVIILGGGPAGAAAAIPLARSGLAVAILERSAYADTRIGDTLSPEANAWLHRLGVWDAFAAVPRIASPGVVSLWDTPDPVESDFLFNPFGNGWHIDRIRFDQMLAKAATHSGTTVLLRARASSCLLTEQGTWRVSGDLSGQRVTFEGRFLIDATGRSRWLGRCQGVKTHAADRLLAFIAHVKLPTCFDHRLYLEAASEGWWYAAPLPGQQAIIAYLTDSDLVSNVYGRWHGFWGHQCARSRLIYRKFESSGLDGPVRVRCANSSWLDKVTGSHWLAVGEAALAHDPLSGCGLCFALASGWCAAQTVIEHLRGVPRALEQFQDWVDSVTGRYVTARREYYGRVSFSSKSLFWTRRV